MPTFDYELILMLDPQAGDDQREKIASDAKSKLEQLGEVKHESNWGMRKMAYEIDRRGEADYRVWRFTGGKDLLDDLDHSLKITDGVLRFRVFKVEADSPNTVPPDTEQIMRRDEDDRGRGRGDRGDRGDRGGRRSRPDSPPAEREERAEGGEERSAEVAPAAVATEAPPAPSEAPPAEAPTAPAEAAPASDDVAPAPATGADEPASS